MPIRRMLLFLWPLLLFFGEANFASAADPSDSPFIVDSWGVEDGLPDSEAIAVLQAKDGYLWIGTLHGLVRFDGNKFTTFNVMKNFGLKSDSIVFLFQDSQTNLWIGTESSGLAMIQNGIVKSFVTETADAGPVTFAREDANGLWFRAKNGIALYRNGKMRFIPNVGVSGSLSLLVEHLLIPSKDGGVWLLWNGTIQKRNGYRLEKNFGPMPWKSAQVRGACEDENGNLIVAPKDAGIYWFDANGHYQHITKADGLSSDSVLSMYLDNAGNLWVGTDGGGLNRIKRKIFATVPGLHPWDARSVAQDVAGGLWTAFNASGLSYWNSNEVDDFNIGRYSNAWTVLVDRKQNVWAGTSTEGLFRFDTNAFVPASGVQILGPAIFALFESRDGKIWAGTQNGLGCWGGNTWKLFTMRDGLSDNSVQAIAEDPTGNLWIGTANGGLNYFDGEKIISHQTTTNGLPGNDISCLYMDGDILWAGTAGHGLARFEDGKWRNFSTSDGLASDSIGYITGDHEGYLWIGSNSGLMRIEKKSLASPDNSFFCRVYGKADGLPTRECSSGSQPATVLTQEGQLFLPTIEGLVSVNPSELRRNLRPPRVLIESVLVDKHEQNTNPLNSAWSPGTIVIPPGGEELEIHYTALNFSAPQAVQFKYRLEGLTTGWTDPGNSRMARYIDLPPGHYRFHLMACNEDGVWSDDLAMDIRMLPHVWQTPAFQITAVLILLGAIVGIVRYVSTQNLQRELQALKQQEVLERERSRIARDLHDQLGANLTQVALLGELAGDDKNLPDEVASHSQQISSTARETIRSLDEIVWAVNPSNDTLEGLANYACKYAQEYLALANLPCRVDMPADLPATTIPPEVRHNVFLAFKEAVHNVVKHAQASEVRIRLRLRPENFMLEIEDNGRGMDKQLLNQTRNGLRNMKKRMEEIGGDFSISPGATRGTRVELTVPLSNGHAEHKK